MCVKLALSAPWEYVLYARLVTRNQSPSEFSIDHLMRGRKLEKYRRASKAMSEHLRRPLAFPSNISAALWIWPPNSFPSAELAALQDRYDLLHADRDRIPRLLEENTRKCKNSKRWVFTTKLNIPPKDKDRVEEQAVPRPQQQIQ